MIESKSENKLKIDLDKIINNADVIDFLGETKYLKFKQERNFEFYSVDERNDFVGLMRRNFFMLTNKFIKIDCYPSLNKKRFGSKTVVETSSIFDSSFESSEEEQKISDKDNNKNKEKKDINKSEVKDNYINNDIKVENNDNLNEIEEKLDNENINEIKEEKKIINCIKNSENEKNINNIIKFFINFTIA